MTEVDQLGAKKIKYMLTKDGCLMERGRDIKSKMLTKDKSYIACGRWV